MRDQLSVRVPPDFRGWLEARAYLSHRSLNATVISLLDAMFEADPLDSLTVRRRGKYFIVRSTYSGLTFGPYATKDIAMSAVRAAFELREFYKRDVIDETG